MMARKEHFRPDGLVRIVEKAYAMNPDGKGKRAVPVALGGARENPQRPYVGHPTDTWMKIWSSPYGDIGGNCLR
jgi:hypothetical protein